MEEVEKKEDNIYTFLTFLLGVFLKNLDSLRS